MARNTNWGLLKTVCQKCFTSPVGHWEQKPWGGNQHQTLCSTQQYSSGPKSLTFPPAVCSHHSGCYWGLPALPEEHCQIRLMSQMAVDYTQKYHITPRTLNHNQLSWLPIIICLILKYETQAEHKWILCHLCFTRPNTEKHNSAFC